MIKQIKIDIMDVINVIVELSIAIVILILLNFVYYSYIIISLLLGILFYIINIIFYESGPWSMPKRKILSERSSN